MRVIAPRRSSTSAAGSGSLYGTSSAGGATGSSSASTSGSGAADRSSITTNGYSRYSSNYDRSSKWLPPSGSSSAGTSSSSSGYASSYYPSSYSTYSSSHTSGSSSYTPRSSLQRSSVGSSSSSSSYLNGGAGSSSSAYRTSSSYLSNYDSPTYSRYGVSVVFVCLTLFTLLLCPRPPWEWLKPVADLSYNRFEVVSLSICSLKRFQPVCWAPGITLITPSSPSHHALCLLYLQYIW